MPKHNRHLPVRLALAGAVLALAVTPVVHHSQPVRVTAVGVDRAPPDGRLEVTSTSSTTTTTTTATPATTITTRPAPRATQPAPATDVDAAIARWFPDNYRAARSVAVCESTLNPSAVGGPNYGLFQINRVHAADFEAVTGVLFVDGWSDADLNARYARHLYNEQGWGPWACRPR